MENRRLTLEQYLYSAIILLSAFDLVLEDKKDMNKLRIYDKDDNCVGSLLVEGDSINLECKSCFGDLKAAYKISCCYYYPDFDNRDKWMNIIKFNVNGNRTFDGDMWVFGYDELDDCYGWTAINYYDKSCKRYYLRVMRDGDHFCYYTFDDNHLDDNYREILSIGRSAVSCMFHLVESGKYEANRHDYANCYNYVVYWDKGYFSTNVRKVENFKVIENEEVKHDKFVPINSVEFNENRGLLMQKINPYFTNKIVELIEYFKVDGVSFLENLIDVAFVDFSLEELKALFGVDIKGKRHQNSADDLNSASFGKGDDKLSSGKVRERVRE